MSSNGLLSCDIVYASGSTDSNYFVRIDGNGNSTIEGDLTLGGDITVGAISSFELDVNIPDADISNTTGVITYTVDASAYPIYPSFVKICPLGDITPNTNSTLIPEAEFVIPMDGYYKYTAQIRLFSVDTLAASGDWVETFFSVAGTTPLNGTINTVHLVKTGSDNMFYVYDGIIMTKLTKGQTVRMRHRESRLFLYSADSDVQVVYRYLGNKAI